MKIRLLKSIPGWLGLLLLAGTVMAAQPQSSAIDAAQEETPIIRFSDKPHAPVDVAYQFQSVPEVGQPLVIELQFRSPGTTRVQDMSYRSESQLIVSDRGAASLVPNSGAENIVSQTITTIPKANGLYHLSVYASVRVDGRLLHRIVSIPVQVGSVSENPVVAEKPSGPKDVDGVPINSLPVRTTITQR